MAVARNIITTLLIGYCMDCNVSHTQEETINNDGILRCRETGALVDVFDVPVPITMPESEPGQTDLAAVREQTIEALIQIGILDMAFHAGVDVKKNRDALEEIAQKFYRLLPESEQQ